MEGYPESDWHIPLFVEPGRQGLERNSKVLCDDIGPTLRQGSHSAYLAGNLVSGRDGTNGQDAADGGITFVLIGELFCDNRIDTAVDVIEAHEAASVVVNLRLDAKVLLKGLLQGIILVSVPRRKAGFKLITVDTFAVLTFLF